MNQEPPMNTPAPGYYWARLMFDPRQWVIIRIYDDLWWSCRSCEHPVTRPEQILEWGDKIEREEPVDLERLLNSPNINIVQKEIKTDWMV